MDIPGDCPFRNKVLETTNHIFVTCDFAYNIWTIISQQCLSPINMNENIIEWLKYIWNCRNIIINYFLISWKKLLLFYGVFGTTETKKMFNNQESNPFDIIEQARFYFQAIFTYNKSTNFFNQGSMTGNSKSKTKKQIRKDYQTPPAKSWLKWNTDASNIKYDRSAVIATLQRSVSKYSIPNTSDIVRRYQLKLW